MILITHHSGEPHGILGAQLAASFFEKRLSLPSKVIGVERNFSKTNLLRYLEDYYQGRERIVAFSHLCGRRDLIDLIQELKEKGFITLLGGPQAKEDYEGEAETDRYPHRFKGLKSVLDIAFQGPVDGFRKGDLQQRGALLEYPWTQELFMEIDWSNLYTFSDRLKKPEVRVGQVLQAIGCPYSAKRQTVKLPPPIILQQREIGEIEIRSDGCIFCDVSKDKGFQGVLGSDGVIQQIERLPEFNGRKIPFELINETPLRSLGNLLEEVAHCHVKLSQINLVCRVDDVIRHCSVLPEILLRAKGLGIRVMFASIGFESFSDRILQYFCKGITLSDIIQCVEVLRRLKDQFRDTLLYRRDEGANHGFIRPTPWDDGETMREMDKHIFLYRFFEDILPDHSTPLIIHHASFLGDWIREIELKTHVFFRREGTWIEWWNPSTSGASFPMAQSSQ